MAVLALALALAASPAASVRPPAACVAGAYRIAAPDPDDAPNRDMPVRRETAHFALRWHGDVVPAADAEAAGRYLEYVRDRFLRDIGFPEPACGSPVKLKVNVFVGAGYGLSGGADALGHMAMWIGPGGVRDRFGLAHEFTHALQAASGGFRNGPYGGWLFESHANWMAHQLPEFRASTHCSVLSVDYPHLHFGSTRVRYCNWQFLEYLKDRWGYPIVNDLWRKAPRPGTAAADGADPVEVLMHNRGWTLAQLNDAFGDWALHNANWDYINPDGSDQGAVYRRAYGGYAPQGTDHLLRTTMLDPLDAARRRFAVPAAWAPHRWGYNLVRLHPDRGATRVTVAFRGVVQAHPAVTALPGLADEPDRIPPPASDWRWGIVAVGADGASRYAPLRAGPRGRATLALRPDDRGLYMIVMATPAVFQHIRWDQPYYAIYRYPWMAQFDGAMPDGYQPGAPPPVAGARRHANGGGWVAPAATVDASAYVGPQARVLAGSVRGNARVEDHAVVDGGRLSDDARASALSVIRGDTVLRDRARAATVFLGLGEYEQGIVLSGDAQNIGDVEQRGASADHGVFYGFVDRDATTRADRGAGRTRPVPEVTAAPVYRWPD